MRCLIGAVTAALLLSGGAMASTLDLGGGWQANWSNGDIGVTVDSVTPEAVFIEISKDFDDPFDGSSFTPRIIDFIQTADDANTVSRIVIRDESITNLTGMAWDSYRWDVLNMGDAWINVPLSQNWSVDPFTNKAFTDPGNQFGDPDKASRLEATGGLIPNFGSFFPGLQSGELVIDLDLTNSTGPLSWTFKQAPLPEPTAVILLAVGALFAVRRR